MFHQRLLKIELLMNQVSMELVYYTLNLEAALAKVILLKTMMEALDSLDNRFHSRHLQKMTCVLLFNLHKR